MTQTLDKPEVTTDSLEGVAPKCCLTHTVLGQKISECENVAVWVGFTPCCGNSALVCADHFKRRLERPFRCEPCKQHHVDLTGWQPL